MCQDLKGSQLSTIAKANTYLKRISPKRRWVMRVFILYGLKVASCELTYPLPKVCLKMIFPFPRWDMLVPVIPAKRLQLAGRFQGHKAKKSLRSQLPPDAELVLEAADEKVGRAGSTFHQKWPVTLQNKYISNTQLMKI